MTKKSSIIFALFMISCIGKVSASPNDDFRAILQREVTAEISDTSLINDIVEIRFQREFIQWQTTHTPQTRIEISNNNLEKNKENPSYSSKSGTYFGIGNKAVVGFQKHINENIGYRIDIGGKKTSNYNEKVGNNLYLIKESNLSLGGYIDWFPFQGNLKISAGVNLNRINTYSSLNANSSANINGKNVNTSSESLDVTYKFSKISPYIGLGYQSAPEGIYGWSSFVDIGLMFGKYDADAKTNLIGQNSVTTQDISYEVDTLRRKILHNNYIPTAVFGLKYSY
jgi:hypothetical protein